MHSGTIEMITRKDYTESKLLDVTQRSVNITDTVISVT